VGKRYACINVNETKDKLRTYQMFLEQGGKVLIDQVFPFGQAREAYARVESGRARGKVVVDVGTAGQARARLSAETSRAGPSSSAAT
jgi:D-arabinose 1-dehydrogenase-like Zn-dependent alcohol dehydrogenase